MENNEGQVKVRRRGRWKWGERQVEEEEEEAGRWIKDVEAKQARKVKDR